MSIRIATENDLSSIVNIYNSTIPSRMSTADMAPVSVGSELLWFNQHAANRPIYVCEANNQIIGWASFENFYGRPAYQATAELSIYTDLNFRNQRIGSKILHYCINQCPDLGIKNIICFIFTHNIASIRLFEKFNFSKWGELPEIAEMNDMHYSLSIMGLKLDPTK